MATVLDKGACTSWSACTTSGCSSSFNAGTHVYGWVMYDCPTGGKIAITLFNQDTGSMVGSDYVDVGSGGIWCWGKGWTINTPGNYRFRFLFAGGSQGNTYFTITSVAECSPDGIHRCDPNNPNVSQECVNGKWISTNCPHGCNPYSGLCNECTNDTYRCKPDDPSVSQKCVGYAWTDYEFCTYGCNPSTGQCNPPPQIVVSCWCSIVQSSAQVGGTIIVDAYAKNDGNTATPSLVMKAQFVKTDGTHQTSVWRHPIGSLAPGQTINWSDALGNHMHWVTSSLDPPGSYKLKYWVET